MMHVGSASDPIELRWLCERAHCNWTPDMRAIKAVDERTGRILGMVGYCDWTHSSVSTHIAVESPVALRRLMAPIFTYPFLECGLEVILATIPGDNAKSRRLVEHMGFSMPYAIRDGWDKGVDMCIYEMRKEDCRWIRREAA